MRVPLPIALLLALAVVGGVWWYGTHDADFLTPPPAAKLAQIRSKVELSLPPADHPNDDAVSVPHEIKPPPPVETPGPTIELGDLHRPPTLHEYADLAPKGTAHLIDLAMLLETAGETQRALLAWERVLDRGKPDESQANAAITAIKRLRPITPDWNTDPAKTLAIVLHAGTAKKTAKILKPILDEAARELERASAGILKVTANVTAGKDNPKTKGPATIALWLAGPAKNARSTEVLSFTLAPPGSLRDEVRNTVFSIVRSHQGPAGSQPPPAAADGGNPADPLNSQVTRLCWLELGTMLNQAPEKHP